MNGNLRNIGSRNVKDHDLFINKLFSYHDWNETGNYEIKVVSLQSKITHDYDLYEWNSRQQSEFFLVLTFIDPVSCRVSFTINFPIKGREGTLTKTEGLN